MEWRPDRERDLPLFQTIHKKVSAQIVIEFVNRLGRYTQLHRAIEEKK